MVDSAVTDVEAALGENRPPQEIRDETLRLLWPLLDAGELVPVSIDNERLPRVQAWPGTARDHLSRLASEWPVDVPMHDALPDFLFGYLVSPKGMESEVSD